MRVTTSRREAEGSSHTHPTTRDQEFSLTSRNKPCCICFTIPHKYFSYKNSEATLP